MADLSLIADPSLFVTIDDPTKDFPGLGFTGSDTLVLDGDDLLITDPTYLADVYNQNDDPVAAYVRANGVIMYNFGGDASCPVWWQDPFLVLPLSVCPPHDPATAMGAIEVADEIGCDSGSFLFLPIRHSQPSSVESAIKRVLAERIGARVALPSGRYRIFYEQHAALEKWPVTFARNVVAHRQP
jgi:hypothetical protein